ncbi:hypothetical protein GobsT_30970 [Gemmata obscuriglobus]|uniref:Uncharacterized protein n=1 Tax=Gemmata obscuriglobus TaxID=114 RepID=A0A2Z3H319_9BACT|nr:hypothetical protein [Gemmata obscuriglobus]AWM38712.1 hypothetical protein C1280_18095 [Gemmata obscuriglobus]QEG28320.1 hypothetical protein GobsT_30970 [Gemmata obscuriglobus]VTS06177.1 unnamed protein product [Gemmata obscuriglobus UQM 2246]
MPMRSIGPFNGLLPEPTGVLVGYLRDPSTFPYLRYAQIIPAPEVQFMYWLMNFDEPVRVPRENDYVWAYDDYRPTGKDFSVQGEWIETRTNRWDFPYTIGETTLRLWKKAGFNVKQMYDDIRGNQFQVHRAWRAVKTLLAATWPTNNRASNPSALLGQSDPVYFDNSLGNPTTPGGTLDPRFLVIKRTFNAVKRRINLATNGAVRRDQLFAVIPPVVAEAISNTHEIQEALKQSQHAKELTDGFSNANDWNLPETYAGFTLVVEDTPRVKINQKADGTMADITVPSEKDYILDTDSVLFTSRQGKLDGVYGGKNFSTLQLYTHNGEARVEAFSEPKHELVEGHIVAEDKFVTPSMVSGFRLDDVLQS